MRLFVAVEMSPEVVDAAGHLIERLRPQASRLAPASRITWLSAQHLHVTVRFIGHVDDAKANIIREVLQPPLPAEPFELTVGGVGAFPPKGPPRVVWAGLTRGKDRLLGLERLVGERLGTAGVAEEDRPYNPHLTLARVRDAAGLRTAALLAGAGEPTLGVTPVAAITLFESRPSPKGSTYVPLVISALAGSSRSGIRE